MPKSCAATSKEQRVLVLVFSKMSATFLPRSGCSTMPFFFISFNFADKSIKYRISSGVKSFNVKKSRPVKFMCPPIPCLTTGFSFSYSFILRTTVSISPTSLLISLLISLIKSDNFPTSPATTAKPLPFSPALAASILAFNARIFCFP